EWLAGFLGGAGEVEVEAGEIGEAILGEGGLFLLLEPERKIGVGGGVEMRGETFELGEDGGDFGGVRIVAVAFESGEKNGDGVGGFFELGVGPADPVKG